jgi:N4-gp56 family major capsid protein
MTRKRTIHDLRKVARVRQSEWWARIFDELMFMYLSGARGINADYIYGTAYAGFATNAFVAPDTQHNLFANVATSKATLAATDKLDLKFIDRAVARADTMGGGTTMIPSIQPCEIDGEEHFVLVMHPWAEFDLRTNTNTASGWTSRKPQRRPRDVRARCSRAAWACTTTSSCISTAG